MRRIYLAASYSRRAEMLDLARQLVARGHIVTSSWITGKHERGRGAGIDQEATVEEKAGWAHEDLADLDRSNTLVSFTEEPGRTGRNRGGRHVETGYAMGVGTIDVMVVGPRENVFHCLADVRHFDRTADLLDWLDREARG